MDNMREEFEEAVVDGVIVGHLFGHEFAKSIRKTQVSDCFTYGKYQNDVLQLSWEVWQASRAALRVELPENCKGMALTVDEFHKQLDKVGVSHKQPK